MDVIIVYDCIMNFKYPIEWPQFFTATILNWLPVLDNKENKMIIVDSLSYMARNRRVELNAYVIMRNHIHLIWRPLPLNSLTSIQFTFLKFTGQQLKFVLEKTNRRLLEQCRVSKCDRNYQIWQRESLSIELFSEKVFKQKLEYIHNNPVNAGICRYPEEYFFSSASFYEYGIDRFGMLTHYEG